jgi:hypothetical protein
VNRDEWSVKKIILLILFLWIFLGALISDDSELFSLATFLFIIGSIVGLILVLFFKYSGFKDLVFRVFILLFSLVLLKSSYEHILDYPLYISKNYSVVTGPAIIGEGRRGKFIEVGGRHFGYNVSSEITINDIGETFKIYYLPNTNIIVDYKILNKD